MTPSWKAVADVLFVLLPVVFLLALVYRLFSATTGLWFPTRDTIEFRYMPLPERDRLIAQCTLISHCLRTTTICAPIVWTCLLCRLIRSSD